MLRTTDLVRKWEWLKACVLTLMEQNQLYLNDISKKIVDFSVLSSPVDWFFWGVHHEPPLGPTNRRTLPLAGACACFCFTATSSYECYRRMVYKLDVLLPFSRYLDCVCIQPVRSNSFRARLTVEQDSPKSEAMVFTPGQLEPEASDRSFR